MIDERVEDEPGRVRTMTGSRPSQEEFDQAVIRWCLAALDVFAEQVGHDALSKGKRETFLRHCHNRRQLMTMAADLANSVEDIPPTHRADVSAWLEERTGISHRIFIGRKHARVLQVLKRGKVRDEDELRLLIGYAGDQYNDATLRQQCDLLILRYCFG